MKKVFLVISLLFSGLLVHAQTFRINTSGPGEGWMFELRTGTGVILSEVPEKYLGNLNNVNIPRGRFGMATNVSVKKMSTGHFEVGYQFDYMRIRGEGQAAGQTVGGTEKVEVLTQGMGHNFMLGYYLKRKDQENRFNYSIFYKIGALSLNNKPLDEDGAELIETDFLANIAVITGWGAGVNYNYNKTIRFVFNAELNRSTDVIEDFYKFYKVFYDSPNTVNKYLFLTAGVKFELNFERKKKKVRSHLPFGPGLN